MPGTRGDRKRWTAAAVLPALVLTALSLSAGCGRANRDLVERIRREQAQVDALDEIERIHGLRRWVYSHGKWANDSSDHIEILRQNALDLTLLFETNSGGVFCGGKAYYLNKISKIFGYRSRLISYGEIGVLTHTLSLIETKRGHLIEDPTFNITYVDHNSNPIYFDQMIEILQNREDDRIWISMDFDDDPEVVSRSPLAFADFDPPRRITQGFNIATYHRDNTQAISYLLNKHDLPDNPIYLFMLIYENRATD
ncbi:MAG: hypothetical protein KJ042_03155 [Deltaproteobacteria bacterium]|nr:hypothetical protein [Deltaproteobacteria bacterium]